MEKFIKTDGYIDLIPETHTYAYHPYEATRYINANLIAYFEFTTEEDKVAVAFCVMNNSDLNPETEYISFDVDYFRQLAGITYTEMDIKHGKSFSKKSHIIDCDTVVNPCDDCAFHCLCSPTINNSMCEDCTEHDKYLYIGAVLYCQKIHIPEEQLINEARCYKDAEAKFTRLGEPISEW